MGMPYTLKLPDSLLCDRESTSLYSIIQWQLMVNLSLRSVIKAPVMLYHTSLSAILLALCLALSEQQTLSSPPSLLSPPSLPSPLSPPSLPSLPLSRLPYQFVEEWNLWKSTHNKQYSNDSVSMHDHCKISIIITDSRSFECLASYFVLIVTF